MKDNHVRGIKIKRERHIKTNKKGTEGDVEGFQVTRHPCCLTYLSFKASAHGKQCVTVTDFISECTAE